MKRSDKLKAGKFDVDVGLVRRLVDRQFPQWAHLPIAPVDDDGWDNWTFRLGDRLKVRLPSDEGYAEQAEKESRWLPLLAPHLPVAVPEPLALGAPDQGYHGSGRSMNGSMMSRPAAAISRTGRSSHASSPAS